MPKPIAITLEVSPELEAQLHRLATACGLPIETYAASLLEEAVTLHSPHTPLSKIRIENTLREMAQFSHLIPALPASAFTRMLFYLIED